MLDARLPLHDIPHSDGVTLRLRHFDIAARHFMISMLRRRYAIDTLHLLPLCQRHTTLMSLLTDDAAAARCHMLARGLPQSAR